ncbi:MAG: MGMT family protein [Saprospirales bacterium]|nr:MAG: MGMT family protein [Saprospirales bacterium]
MHFYDKVYAVVERIPPGRVTTYGLIADFLALGSARMVGWALNQSHKSGLDIPAHRVVNRKGELSGRAHFPGEGVMQQRLEAENIEITDHRVKDFNNLLWNPSEHLL